MSKPLVAIVGRPNVGKSSIFNRLTGQRLAVVDDHPGTTRDRLLAEAEWSGVTFDLVDTGGIEALPSSLTKSNPDPLAEDSALFLPEIRAQAEMAIAEADAILFVTEATNGLTSADQEVAEILRRRQQRGPDGQLHPPVLLLVNKAENADRRNEALEFYALGMGEPYAISATHGLNLGDMLDALIAVLPKHEPEPKSEAIHIAIVGRPNVGKSSLFNQLLGEERAIVSPIPGTTRDALDTHLTYDGLPVVLIDTAGMRRRGHIDPGVEKWSVLRALRAINRSDVALLVIDATEPFTAQDAHIAGFILDEAKSVVVVVNKWDAIPKDTYTLESYQQRLRDELKFLSYVPVVFISAKTGLRCDQVLPLALRVQEERLVRIPTSELNRLIREAVANNPPASHGTRQLKISYATQVRTDPPTFLFHVNDPRLLHFSYRRHLENILRATYPFTGTPLRLSFRKKNED